MIAPFDLSPFLSLFLSPILRPHYQRRHLLASGGGSIVVRASQKGLRLYSVGGGIAPLLLVSGQVLPQG